MKDKIFDFLDKLSCEGKMITVSMSNPVFTAVNSFDDFTVVNEDSSVEIMSGDTYYSINCNSTECMFENDENGSCMVHLELENCIMEICGV